MKRKLVKQAGQAITLTLPINWIRENNLKAGDEIELEFNEKDLILKSNKKTKVGILDLDTTSFNKRMKYIYINSAYATGIDEIRLETEKNYCHDLNQTMGFAVVEQKGTKQIIKDISGDSSADLDEMFKRVYQMILSFYDRAIEEIFGKNNLKLEDIKKISGCSVKYLSLLENIKTLVEKSETSDKLDPLLIFLHSEPGCGKEHLAKLIHLFSKRAAKHETWQATIKKQVNERGELYSTFSDKLSEDERFKALYEKRKAGAFVFLPNGLRPLRTN